jgi:hypothetical protein
MSKVRKTKQATEIWVIRMCCDEHSVVTELSALEQRRDKTRALKQGMMHKLLTGGTK